MSDMTSRMLRGEIYKIHKKILTTCNSAGVSCSLAVSLATATKSADNSYRLSSQVKSSNFLSNTTSSESFTHVSQAIFH